MSKYELISNGALYDSVETNSFASARKYFAAYWIGKYQILNTSTGERKNVRLKS